MAERRIANEKHAHLIGGSSVSYTENLAVTRVRAVTLGCNVRGSYEDLQLVALEDLYRLTDTWCSCNSQCACNTVCSCQSGNYECSCESNRECYCNTGNCSCHTSDCFCDTNWICDCNTGNCNCDTQCTCDTVCTSKNTSYGCSCKGNCATYAAAGCSCVQYKNIGGTIDKCDCVSAHSHRCTCYLVCSGDCSSYSKPCYIDCTGGYCDPQGT